MITRAIARLRDPARREPWWIIGCATAEASSGATLAAWGGAAAWLDAIDALPAYQVLARHLDAWTVQGSAMALGLAAVGIVVLDYRKMRWVLAWGLLVAWHGLAVALFKAPLPAPAAVVFYAWGLIVVPSIVLLRPKLPSPCQALRAAWSRK